MGELTDKIKGNVNEAIGKVKQKSDNPNTRDEGAAQERLAQLRRGRDLAQKILLRLPARRLVNTPAGVHRQSPAESSLAGKRARCLRHPW